MRIAFDLDDVLADTLNAVIQFHNETYKTTFVRSDFHSYDWWKVWGGTREQAIAKYFDFTRTSNFTQVKPLAGAVEGTRTLAKNHELIVLTSRQVELEEATLQWVETYYPKVFKKVYVSNHPRWAASGITMTKKQICDREQVDALVEDSLEYAVECVTDGRPVLLLNSPWNQGETPKNVQRIYSWKEIVTYPLWTKK